MIRQIVAIDAKHGIAKAGVQPWKLPGDEQYFSEKTKLYGGLVLMGRKTFEVIGRPLPERQNFVVTRNTALQTPGVQIVHDVSAFLDAYDDVWVIGGAELYEATLAVCDELYVTEIEADYDCDTFYPAFLGAFELSSKSPVATENGTNYRYCVYTRRP